MIQYGLIGKKLGHSFSARYFNEKFGHENLPARYDLFELEKITELPSLIERHPDLRGLNVTIPYKQEVLPYLSSLSPEAEAIGAVNTIRIDRSQGKTILVGHNTDAIGFQEAIRPLLKGRRKALILGLGGASKAVNYSLHKLGIETIGVSRRKLPGSISYDDLTQELMAGTDIIINCTPLGMWPDIESAPEIPYNLIDSRYLCFDLVYNPQETMFMKLCAERGAEVSNGLKMLYGQADAAYRFWNTVTFAGAEVCDSGIVEKSVMSREIRIIADGEENVFYRSIARYSIDSEGKISKIVVSPFEQELPSVEYFDHPLTFILGQRPSIR